MEKELLAKIKVLRSVAWEGLADESTINSWLENFNTPEDRRHALYLLSKFVYFGGIQVRAMLKSLYRDKYKIPLISRIRLDSGNSTDLAYIGTRYFDELKETRFVGLGDASESGEHLLYFFRQENTLPKFVFMRDSEIISETDPTGLKFPDVRRYIFIDDFCGSGRQGVEYAEKIVDEIKRKNPNIEICYYVLVGQDEGLQKIRDNANFDQVSAVYELDRSFRCFDDQSRLFRNPPVGTERDASKNMASLYGCKLVDNEHALGYCDSQLLMGFQHNTPDNTLPIIWSSNATRFPWSPIFKRYPKF